MKNLQITSFLKFTFLIVVVLFGCTSQPESTTETTPTPPNIILIMADDLGYETLSSYGGESYTTPNLDKLAQEGMLFERCYSTPLCTPSRVQLMTGMYNFRNYIGFGLLDPKEKTFAHYMQEQGYKTCIAGKWQLLGNEHQRNLANGAIGSLPAGAGFDDYCLWQVEQLGSRYKDPLLTIKDQGTKKFDGQYGPDLFTEYIQEFIKSNKDSSFFVYYPMVLVHDPFVPSPDHPDFTEFVSGSKVNDTTYFGDMMTYMDKKVGEIIQTVDEQGIRENTLIIFIGDNGTDTDVVSMFKGRKFRGDKGTPTDAGTHVPFIANWKGTIEAGKKNPNLVDFTDFLPSIMDIVQADSTLDLNADGTSFYAQLMDEDYQPRDWVFGHYDPNWGRFEPRRYVHDGNWKLYENGEFYDIAQDPLEKNPLDITEQPEGVQQKAASFRNVLNDLKP